MDHQLIDLNFVPRKISEENGKKQIRRKFNKNSNDHIFFVDEQTRAHTIHHKIDIMLRVYIFKQIMLLLSKSAMCHVPCANE